jgi:hypothetical protein
MRPATADAHNMRYSRAHVLARARDPGRSARYAVLHVHGHVLSRLTARPHRSWTRGPGREAPEQPRAAR